MRMTVHVGITKTLLMQLINEHGQQFVFGSEPFPSDTDAMIAVRDDEREVFLFDACDNMDETGHCKGHAKEPLP